MTAIKEVHKDIHGFDRSPRIAEVLKQCSYQVQPVPGGPIDARNGYPDQVRLKVQGDDGFEP